MATPLNLLVVEDSQLDADLILDELRQAGFDPKWKRVQTKAEFLAEIGNRPDIILSDYAMPQFTGLEAAKLLQERGMNIPFLLISGTVGEDVAVEAMKHGAVDYLLKDRLVRLGSAVRGALEQQRLRAQRQRAEDELRESEKKFRQLAENINEVFWITDPERHQMVYVSPAYERIWGRACESLYLSPQSWLEAIHPEDRPRVLEAATTRQKGGNYAETYRIVRPDGLIRWIHDQAFPVRDFTGKVYRIVGTAEDVTERKKLEENLRESEAELRVTFENAPLGVGLIKTGGHFLKTNRALQQMLDYSEEELRGKAFSDFTHPDDVEAGEALYQEMIEGKRDHFQIEKRYLRKGGQIVYGRLTASVVRGPAGQAQYAIGMVENITEKKMLETQFLRAQRMENIGTLAGGVAHDLNNVLAPILMSCELLQMEARDEGTRNLVGMIKGSAQRGADLVKQVLSFARGVEGRRIAVQPKHLIREMVNIIRLTFPKSVSIQSSMPKSLWLLSGDPTQLHQVLLNLCVNARDAMPDEGILQITAENVLLDADSAGLAQSARPGPYVVIKVIDTGTGILPDARERIFDPFFTTKEPGKGTGLGLSTTLGIVRSHGGFINVASEPGKGSTFEVWLPADAGEHPSTALNEETQLPRGNGEVILVVDDEVSLRLLTRDTLESFGYVVLTATNGADALGIYSRHKDNINAVLTDAMMPVMDGIALTRAITQINPDVRVILASGLSNTEYQNQAAVAGVKRFLPKPYKAELLLTCLAEILHDQ